MHQHPSQLMNNLVGNASHRSGDSGFPFPQSFRDGEPEAFLQRFLHDDRGSPLQRVDLQRAPGRKIENDDVRIFAGFIPHFLQNGCAFGIVARSASGQH